MSYRFNTANSAIIDRVCEINNISAQNLDISNFKPDYEIDLLKDFKEKILSLKDKRFFIVGDYDCDGICATAIMKKLLDDLKISNNYYIPSRSKEGYGLNEKIVDTAIENGFDVLLCVDNGVVAKEELLKARNNKITTLVIDHHEYSDIPDVDGLLHPVLFPEEYDDMCAGGLCALLSNSFRYDEYTTVLGGLATLADMVRVFGYNRFLLKEMIALLNNNIFVPINYLSGTSLFTYEGLSFNVIPKINAISRLEEKMNVNHMVRFLLNYNDEANQYLNTIEAINKQRKELTKSMVSLSQRLIDDSKDVIVLKSDVFVEGLCGLIANRLMYEYNKPVIILSVCGTQLKGSGRSPKGSNLYAYLKNTENLFTAFGGHAQAVGLSIDDDKYDSFIEYIDNNSFTYPEIEKDVLVIRQNDIDESLIEQLDMLKPFGSGFEEPLIGINELQIEKSIIISKGYPKFILNDNLEAIGFNSEFAHKQFNMIIGKLKRDDYYHNKLSMIIEDLIEF